MTVDINRPDEDTMWKLLKENPGNAVGAILRLSWLQGMTREEICSLTSRLRISRDTELSSLVSD